VIYLCGSTGIVGDSFRYCRMMAGMGFVVLAPDMMVSAAVKGSTLRTRQPKACMLLDSAASDYWSKISL
jgi:dienelactone hydrolase